MRFVRVRATTGPAAFADREAVLVAVKSYATADALAPLRGILLAHALVAPVQNGIDNVEAARTALPSARIVAGTTTQGAMRSATAACGPVNRGTTTFACSDAAAPTSDELAAAFTAAGLDARVAEDVDALLWRS